MKKLSLILVEIIKLAASCAIISLLFIPIFHEVAVLPGFSASGESITHSIDYYYSIYDKIAREGWSALIWIAVSMSAVSIMFCVLNIVVKDNKALKITGHVICGISIILFLVLLFIACSIWYAY